MRRTLALVVVLTVMPAGLFVSRAVAASADPGTPASGGSTPPWLGAVPGLGEAAPDGGSPQGSVTMTGCTIANPMFGDDPGRMRRFVPPRYELGTNAFFGPRAATILVAVLSCENVSVERRRPTRTVLALVAVQVEQDVAGDDATSAAWSAYTRSTLSVLTSSSWYLVAGHTSNAALAARMRGDGLPVKHAAGLTSRFDYAGDEKTDRVVIPVRRGAYRLTTTTRFPDPFVHNHDWRFFHENRRGKHGGFLLHLHAMSDSSCGYWFSPAADASGGKCGATFTAPADSRIAEVLGAPKRKTPYAFNHPPSRARGYITVGEGGNRR